MDLTVMNRVFERKRKKEKNIIGFKKTVEEKMNAKFF
jgi:hypothetical protein